MFLFWRLYYGLIDSLFFTILLASLIRIFKWIGGQDTSEKLLEYLSRSLRWPRRPWGLGGLQHVNRLTWRVARRVDGGKGVPVRQLCPRQGKAFRVGCIAPFATFHGFPPSLFEGFPRDAELHIYDVLTEGRFAEYLQPLARCYTSVDLTPVADNRLSECQEGLFDLAKAINQADLDMLIFLNDRRIPSYLLDLVETPCIVNQCTGSALFFHEKVSFHLFPQPQSDYFVVDKHLFCAPNRSRFGDELVYPLWVFYDIRDIDLTVQPSWIDREPLIVFHGRLHKLATSPVLDLIFDLMEVDSTLDFVLIGRDTHQTLDSICQAAVKRALQARVHYEGHFNRARDTKGMVADPAWQKCLSYLRRARLAPDPWPFGGGGTRFEAYAAGTPLVHMGVRFDPASWGKRQHAVVELPDLVVPRGTANSVEQYRQLCQQCLYDKEFANRLASEQLTVVHKLSNASVWWQQLFTYYHDWFEHNSGVAPNS